VSGEQRAIALAAGGPVTVGSLVRDLHALGIRPGMVLIVHCSLSALGWVCGGPVAVILALQRVLRSYGTLVMPAHSGDLSDPSLWENPPVPKSWWETIRRTMPAYDPELTPTRGMGAVAECFRKLHSTVRSAHPQVSFTAWGENALKIVQDHSLEFGLGERSPLARVYELDGRVLLLGVDHGSNTSLHLGENRARYHGRRTLATGAPVKIGGHRRWKRFRDINYHSDDFERLGRDFEREYKDQIRKGMVGYARAQLFAQRLCVDYAEKWIEHNRR
jgi:aminoglycoside 3-N-acetyltransferase